MPLRVRVGIHTGDVIRSEDDFFGTVVNKAARVAAVSVAGKIRVSDANRIMVGTTRDFDFEGSARVQIKGLDGDHLTHCLIWQGRRAHAERARRIG